jgi:hypothetical protein
MKKVNEISILCGIEACAIIYDQNNPQAEVWPSDAGVKGVLARFRSLPEFERSKKNGGSRGLFKGKNCKSQ